MTKRKCNACPNSYELTKEYFRQRKKENKHGKVKIYYSHYCIFCDRKKAVIRRKKNRRLVRNAGVPAGVIAKYHCISEPYDTGFFKRFLSEGAIDLMLRGGYMPTGSIWEIKKYNTKYVVVGEEYSPQRMEIL